MSRQWGGGMTTDQILLRERFRGYVELFGEDRPFISRAEERRLLEQGIAQFALGADEVRGILVNVAGRNNIRLEREVDRRMLPILARFGGKRKKISKAKFNEAALLYNDFADGLFTPDEARLKVKQLMQENRFRAKRGMTLTRRWYNKIGKDKRRPLLQEL